MDTEYLVLDEHTLCYRKPGMIGVDILAARIGSQYIGRYDAPMPSEDRVRPATKADFEEFRVWPPPHMRV